MPYPCCGPSESGILSEKAKASFISSTGTRKAGSRVCALFGIAVRGAQTVEQQREAIRRRAEGRGRAGRN